MGRTSGDREDSGKEKVETSQMPNESNTQNKIEIKSHGRT